jgi:hypothetical protein
MKERGSTIRSADHRRGNIYTRSYESENLETQLRYFCIRIYVPVSEYPPFHVLLLNQCPKEVLREP